MNKAKNIKNQLKTSQENLDAIEELDGISESESTDNDEMNDDESDEDEGKSEDEDKSDTEAETETKKVIHQSTIIAPSTSTAKTVQNSDQRAGPTKAKAVSKRVTTAVLVAEAIENLNTKSGSSMYAIKKYIMSKEPVPDENRLTINIKRYLKIGVANGKLMQVKGVGAVGSFKLNKKPSPSEKITQTKAKAAKPKKPEPTEKVTQKGKSVVTKAPKEKVSVKPKTTQETVKKAALKSSKASKADMNNNAKKPKPTKAQPEPAASVQDKTNKKQKKLLKTASTEIMHATKHAENGGMAATRRKLYNNAVSLVVNPLLKLNTSIGKKSTQSKKSAAKSQGKQTKNKKLTTETEKEMDD